MESRTNNQNIVYLKRDNKEHVKAVCNLHLKLLPESILSKLGYLFFSKFYNTKLIEGLQLHEMADNKAMPKMLNSETWTSITGKIEDAISAFSDKRIKKKNRKKS